MNALITNTQPHVDGENSRQLLLVYGIMAVAGMAAAVIPQVLLRGELWGNLTVIATGLLLVTGVWSAAVSSLPYGAIGGGLVGMVFTLSGASVHMVGRGMEPSESMKLLVASTVISSILGSLLGLAGGLIVWAFRHRRSSSPTT